MKSDRNSNSFIFFLYVLVTYKDEENQMKNEGARVVTPIYSYIFKLNGSLLCSWWMGVAENQTYSNFYGSPCYLQDSKMMVLEWS